MASHEIKRSPRHHQREGHFYAIVDFQGMKSELQEQRYNLINVDMSICGYPNSFIIIIEIG